MLFYLMAGKDKLEAEPNKTPSPREDLKLLDVGYPLPEKLSDSDKQVPRLQTDPAEIAKQQIDLHEKINAARSYLSKGVSFLNPEEELSLANLKALTADYEKAKESGDSKKLEKVKEELTKQIEKDAEALAKQEEFCRYGSGFLKTAGLFMRGKSGFAGTAVAYALDQMNPNDPFSVQTLDGSLGVAKGLALRGIFSRLGEAQVSIAAKGVGLGITSRFAEIALDRKTYLDEKGALQFDQAAKAIGHTTLGKEALCTDAVTFGLAHGIVRFSNGIAGGIIESSPLVSSMATAFSFGLLSGSHFEVQRQIAQDKTLANFDFGQVLRAGAIQGSLDSLAGSFGGLQARQAHAKRLRNFEQPGKPSPTTGNVKADIGAWLGEHPSSKLSQQEMERHLANITKDTNVPEIWEPERNIFTLSAQERKELISLVRSTLFKREHAHEFASTILWATSDWNEDLSSQAKTVNESYQSLNTRAAQVKERIVVPGLLDINELNNSNKARSVLADKPELGQVYESYVQARSNYAAELKTLNEIRAMRLLSFSAAVDVFTNSLGLPSPTINLYDDLGSAGASYQLGRGKIGLRRQVMDGRANLERLASSVYHELTHSQQDALIIRDLADHLGIGKQADVQQVLELRKQYKEHTGENLEEAWLKQVLWRRQGEMLSAEEHDHAQLLSVDIKNRRPVGPMFRELGNHFRIAQRELLNLPKPNSGYVLIDRLMNDPKGTLTEHLFGAKEPPDEVRPLVSAWHRFQVDPDAPWDHAHAQTILSDLLSKRLAEINRVRKQAYEAYLNGLHEKEAWAVGELARLATISEIRRSNASKPEPG